MRKKSAVPVAVGEKGTPEKILSAAYRCIAARGYANVSLRDIAAEAGVVLSQLNYYYKNKEGLFIEVVRMMARSLRQEIEQGLKRGATPKERVSCLVSQFQEMLQKRPEFSSLLLDLTSMSLWQGSFRDLLRDFYKDLYELTEKQITAPQTAPSHYSPKAMAHTIINTLMGTAMQAALYPEEQDVRLSLSSLCISL